jgi:hypothetical protein
MITSQRLSGLVARALAKCETTGRSRAADKGAAVLIHRTSRLQPHPPPASALSLLPRRARGQFLFFDIAATEHGVVRLERGAQNLHGNHVRASFFQPKANQFSGDTYR